MQNLFECSLLEMFVIPNFGLGSVVLIIVKCAHHFKREGGNAFQGGIWAGFPGFGMLAAGSAAADQHFWK